MTTQTPWATPQLMVDWFNQLDDPDEFFKDNGYRRFPFIQDSIFLRSDSIGITFKHNRDDDNILGYALISVEMFIEDRDVEAAEMTFALKLPIDLEPKEIFNYIDSKVVSVQNARKEINRAFELEWSKTDA